MTTDEQKKKLQRFLDACLEDPEWIAELKETPEYKEAERRLMRTLLYGTPDPELN